MTTSTATSRETIAAAFDTMAALTESFTVNVPAADFKMWVEELGVATFAVNRRDGADGVHAYESGYRNGVYVQVHCIAASIDGHDLPERDAKPWYLTLPAAEAAKLRGEVR